ncbi:DUF1178 family protein [Acetobacter orleanensis]|uniref:DUF1178 domain-containing protein n=1 Tax=Acetobacter orleanensis TaxID=104099 RepID=A0A4Y3TLI2_9PROT|nr:DUF1178 family protein [Acetobacter orleanensis]KXV62014.1 hypothetical protein AD949_12170 [Acetobacter orleanensis]PCD80348.1 DUF1178 domain-containing protein [Acetobacter orleanensis]GAN68897.1 hypothetical protein Abol_024_036 [Acetobacter orleanensis JCM 7639]GBR30810.1 hypothetical protein AA0473_2366 [Acetobacter orleanensis NRIC 0473]GEB81695.1 hypothetical protein AOR01nite_01720 [Acetobacter orleanensis]
MICYRLRCRTGHEFEGWYRDSATFAQLQAGGLLSCPECGNADVQQALMAPAIARQSRTAQAETVAEKPAGAVLPDQMLAALQKIRQAVEAGCDNMGSRFAEEALRIHHKEAPERGIYGQASEEDRAMLAEEGVTTLTIPWVRRADG